MIVYLRYKPEKIVDRDKFINTYTSSAGYKMLKGAPLLVNVEGSYISVNDIPGLLVSRKYAKQVNDWLTDLKSPSFTFDGVILNFRWRR